MTAKSPYSVRGIAETMGIPKSTVHRLIQKTRKQEAESKLLDHRRQALMEYLDGPCGDLLLDLASFDGGLDQVRDWIVRAKRASKCST